MIVGWAVRRFHAALTRPFRKADIDYAARERIERRQQQIAARLAGYRQWRAATDLRRQREGA